jgi:glucose-1-phosphate thymidylyltransferase
MNIIIPMAGMGKRMRPHTLTIAKPLIPVAGKPIVERLVEDITKVCGEKVQNIGFIIAPDFGVETELLLKKVAERQGAVGHIFYQTEALGTAHAILCAKELLHGKTVVAFADTLFKADFVMDTNKEGVIWVQSIPDPSQFGVVKLNAAGIITDFVEKPTTPVSNLAIIGIYYFKDGVYLNNELQYLIDNNITEKGEYQLTNALENMKRKGTQFVPGEVTEWLDCGNKNATVHTNARMLEFKKEVEKLVSNTFTNNNSVIIAPCYIGDNVTLTNCVVGPYASIGANCVITNTILTNSIVQQNASVNNSVITNTMIGAYATINKTPNEYSISDYSTLN